MEGMKRILEVHPFFKELKSEHLKIIQGCASNVRFEPGEFIYREGADAEKFYLIREGKISLEMFITGRGAITVETLNEGDLLGWSWLISPYKWRFDSRALTQVRAIALDGKCIRGKCDLDHDLGYELMRQCAGLTNRRLQATRMQLLDVYGAHSS